jgi:hypothetical protein
MDLERKVSKIKIKFIVLHRLGLGSEAAPSFFMLRLNSQFRDTDLFSPCQIKEKNRNYMGPVTVKADLILANFVVSETITHFMSACNVSLFLLRVDDCN